MFFRFFILYFKFEACNVFFFSHAGDCKELIQQSFIAEDSVELQSLEPFISGLHELVTENCAAWANALPYFQCKLYIKKIYIYI